MSKEPPTSGTYVPIYLSAALYDFIAERARESGISMPGWIRGQLVELCPPDVREHAKRANTMPTEPKPPRPSEAVHQRPKKTIARPEAEAPPAKPNFDELIEKHRDRVRDLEAKAYSENAISAVLRIPYRVVQEILNTKAPPKKGGQK